MLYLDNAATMKPYYYKLNYWGNPNSPHEFGRNAHEFIEQVRQIKDYLSIDDGILIFGGNATTLVSQLINLIHQREIETGESVSYFVPDKNHECTYRIGGFYVPNSTKKIFFHEAVNSVTGEIVSVTPKNNPNIFSAIDLTAAIGHINIHNICDDYDCCFASAHKWGGFQGSGFIWFNNRFADYLDIDRNEPEKSFGILGTPDIRSIEQMYYAFNDSCRYLETAKKVFANLTHEMYTAFSELGIEAERITGRNRCTDAIHAIHLPGVKAEPLVQYLSGRNIYISPGHSACSGEADYRVLKAYGLSQEKAEETIRVSFSRFNSREGIHRFVEKVAQYKNLFLLEE